MGDSEASPPPRSAHEIKSRRLFALSAFKTQMVLAEYMTDFLFPSVSSR